MTTQTKKSVDEITRDVKADWSRPKDQATIRRRHPKLTCPMEIQTAEIRQRVFLQGLPSMFGERARPARGEAAKCQDQ